jgi:hypothetical protein
MHSAIADAVRDGTSVINFLTWPLPLGTTLPLGAASVTIVGGWTE